MNALVVHGPNLNLLGERETSVYGHLTLEEINRSLDQWGKLHHVALEIIQSNYEGEIIDALHRARDTADFVIVNPGAYTHYSYAIRDAIASVQIPVVEVHISNIFSRGEFRAHSVTASACRAIISGMGEYSYVLGLEAGRHLAGISAGKNEVDPIQRAD